jgi:hypothetical protein
MLAVLAAVMPAAAQQQDRLDAAIAAASKTFDRARPALGPMAAGVDTAAYRAALSKRRFYSTRFHAELALRYVTMRDGAGRCPQFAAYVVPAPDNGVVTIHLCPEFFRSGADGLRETTILHELVHVVAGPDECQAMAFTAQVQLLATGTFQPVDRYWASNGCDRSAYRLPK